MMECLPDKLLSLLLAFIHPHSCQNPLQASWLSALCRSSSIYSCRIATGFSQTCSTSATVFPWLMPRHLESHGHDYLRKRRETTTRIGRKQPKAVETTVHFTAHSRSLFLKTLTSGRSGLLSSDLTPLNLH